MCRFLMAYFFWPLMSLGDSSTSHQLSWKSHSGFKRRTEKVKHVYYIFGQLPVPVNDCSYTNNGVTWSTSSQLINMPLYKQSNLNSFCTISCDSGGFTMELTELTWTLKKKKKWTRKTLAISCRDNIAGVIYWSLRLRNVHLLKEKKQKAVGLGAWSDLGEGFLHSWWQGP